MRTKRRLLSTLLALALVLSLLPVTALADSDSGSGSGGGSGTHVWAGEYINPECTGDRNCPVTSGHQHSCPKALTYDPLCTNSEDCVAERHVKGCPKAPCTGNENCLAADGNHHENCVSLCTQNESCPNTEGNAAVHQSGCPRAKKEEAPVQPTVLTLKNPTVSFKQEGRDIIVSYGISSDPSVSPFLCEPFFYGIGMKVTVGTGAPLEYLATGPLIGSDWTFKNAVPTADKAGSGPLPVFVEVIFDYAETVSQGGKSYFIQGNNSRATATGTCTPSGDPEEAVENPGLPLGIIYDYATGALTWDMVITYQNGVKPGPTTKIDQFFNEHFILTMKHKGTVVEKDVHFDTVSSAAGDIKVNRVQQRFTTTYKPLYILTIGEEYTIELLNERSMGGWDTLLIGTGTFIAKDAASKPVSLKAALEQLINGGFTAASKASDVRDAILSTVSGSTAASKVKNLLSSLQGGGSAAEDLMDLIQETEEKFLKATGISVNFKSASSLGTSISASGLGLNSAVSKEITLEAAAPGKSLDVPAGVQASLSFSLSASGLSDNKSLSFPIQVSMKLPDGFSSKDPIYVLRSGGSEKLEAYTSGGNAVFTTDTLGDFVLVQESTQSAAASTETASFSDVPASHSFYKEISWVSQKGVMNGTGSGRFTPGGNVNRQQLWMVLARMAGANPANMAEARTWAINNGISDGTTPTGSVSRQQLVTMLCRYAVNQGIALSGAADLGTYSDSASVSGYAQDALAWAVGNGIVGGTSDGRLNPQGGATRAHFAAFLYRFGQKTGM